MFRVLPIALFILALLLGASRAQLLNIGLKGGAGYIPQGVTFSTGAYAISSNTPLTGATNTYTSGLISVWVNNTAATGNVQTVFVIGSSSTNYFNLNVSNSSGHLVMGAANTSGTLVVSYASVTTFTGMGTSTWAHFLGSFNTATPRCQIYVNDAGPEGSPVTCASGAIGYAVTGAGGEIGAQTGTFGPFNANMADLQFWWNVDVDLSVTANRRLFIDRFGNAVNPGVAASALGTPQVLATGPAGSGWVLNKGGTAGTFTLATGSITAAGSNPP